MEMVIEFGDLQAPVWTFPTIAAAQAAAIDDEALIGRYAAEQSAAMLLKLQALAPVQWARVINVRWQFADAAERRQFGEQTAQASDVAGYAMQEDGSLWQLVSVREPHVMRASGPGAITDRARWVQHAGSVQTAAFEARRAHLEEQTA